MIRLLILAAGIALAAYVGIWWGFIGGIVDIIEAAKATPVESYDIACGIATFIFGPMLGWGIFFLTCAIVGTN